MKRKVGELFNKPIVIGNKNEVTKNEIHVDEIINVPTSGEGETESTMEYFRAESINELDLKDFATLLKFHNERTNSIFIAPTTFFSQRSYDEDNTTLIAVGIDFQSEYRMQEPFNGKLIDVLLKMGFPKAVIDAIPRITEEEFYTL